MLVLVLVLFLGSFFNMFIVVCIMIKSMMLPCSSEVSDYLAVGVEIDPLTALHQTAEWIQKMIKITTITFPVTFICAVIAFILAMVYLDDTVDSGDQEHLQTSETDRKYRGLDTEEVKILSAKAKKA